MRDPDAKIIFEGDNVFRHLRAPMGPRHFLRSDLVRQWQDCGDFIKFEIVNDCILAAPRIPFVGFPTEWSDLQFYQAGKLTLRLQREAIKAGYDLKDASAWNIIFIGNRPVFCDLLSFCQLTEKHWRAAGQFARHFILPLLISKKHGLPAHKIFLAWRDGMPHDVANQMMGARRFLTRYWPLMAKSRLNSLPAKPTLPKSELNPEAVCKSQTRSNATLEWMLGGVKPVKRSNETLWGNYINERSHYSADDLKFKQELIAQWLRTLKPRNVIDFGCNSGEFSRLAAIAGAEVLALDADHNAIMRGAERSSGNIQYLVAQLDDLRGGFGWNGSEFSGLPLRLFQWGDLVMTLALNHHLILGASIPLNCIARFMASCTRNWLIAELISPQDDQVALLKSQYNRDDPFPSMSAQEEIFITAGFDLVERYLLPLGTRSLVLFKKGMV